MVSEYCISSVVDHPNVIKTMDLVLDNNFSYCIVMEHCSGGDLYSLIKQNTLCSSDIKNLFKQLLCGLSYLHGLGIAHRDIKPENLLIKSVSGCHILKITDFGEADVFREVLYPKSRRLSEGVCGSIPYMAPEVFSKTKYDGSQADVWSAAIVYLCMIFQGVPFTAAVKSDPNYKLYQFTFKNRKYPAFNLLDKDNKSMLYEMLHPVPEKRFTIQDILKLTWVANY